MRTRVVRARPPFRFSITAGVLAFGLLLVFIPLGGVLYLRNADYYLSMSHGAQNAEFARWLAGRLEWRGADAAELASPGGAAGALPAPFAWQRVYVSPGVPGAELDSGWFAGAGRGLAAELPFAGSNARREERPRGPEGEALAALARRVAAAKRRESGTLPGGLIYSAVPYVHGAAGASGAGVLLFLSDRSGIVAYKSTLSRLGLSLTAASFVLALVLGAAFHAAFTRPLKRLRAEAAALVASAPGASAPAGPLRLSSQERLDEIGDLSRSFAVSFQALLDTNAATAAFAADVLHELKNPLAGARGAIELLAARAAAAPDAGSETRRLLELALRETCRTEARVYTIHELGELRLHAGEGASTELLPLAAELADYYGLGGRVRILTEGVASGQCAAISAERLGRALRNLIDNALDFSPGEAEVLVVFAEAPGGGVEISVADRGPGLAAAESERVFERFYSTRKAEGSGLKHAGLGLSIARSLAEGAGGSLSYQAPEGGGARFVLRLALAPAPRRGYTAARPR